MRKTFKIVGLTVLVGVVAAALFGAVALADEPEMPQGGRWGRIQEFAGRMKDAFAERLGKTPEELDEAWSGAHSEMIERALEEGAITQEQADRMLEQESTFLGRGMMTPFARSRRMPQRMPFGFDIMGQGLEAIADILDTDVDALKAQLQEGQSIAEIAGDQLDDVKKALMDKATEAVNQAVENGRIDEERAADILANLEERLDDMLASPCPLPGGMMGPGDRSERPDVRPEHGEGEWPPTGRMPGGRPGRGGWPGGQPGEGAETQTTSNL